MFNLLGIILSNPAVVDIVSGLARHFLTSAGAILVAKNYMTADQQSLVIGAAMTIVGVVWSVWTKALPDVITSAANAAATPAKPAASK